MPSTTLKYIGLINAELRKKLLAHVSKTLAVSNRRPAEEITDALLSWDRAMEHFVDLEKGLGAVRGKKLLEIGSGFGLFLTITLANGAKAIGLEPAKNKSYTLTSDISKEILKKAGFSPKNIKSGFGEKLPFANNSFDIVCSFYTLEHVNNVEKVFAEATRVLKPGGHIFFEVPNYGSFWEGHYGIPWIPYLPKYLAKIYVWFWGKPSYLINELQLVTPSAIKQILKKLPLDEIDLGKALFRKKMLNFEYTSVGTITSAEKIIKVLRTLGLLKLCVYLAAFLNLQTPLVICARKHDD
jgi:ubiquinone/menaquinone biosynthesis C-methylase UbiE